MPQSSKYCVATCYIPTHDLIAPTAANQNITSQKVTSQKDEEVTDEKVTDEKVTSQKVADEKVTRRQQLV